MGWWSDRFERESSDIDEKTLPARRRRLLLISMILVIPLGVFAVGTGINVALATAVRTSFAAGDYDGAAAWARAGVSLNPFDAYLPHYNLGTAYAAGDLLPEAVPELQTALDAAPSPEAACYPRANLALTYVRLGNRYFDDKAWDDAIDAYRLAKALWAKQKNDVCHQDQSFSDTAESSSEEAQQGEDEAEQQQQQDQQNPNPSGTPNPNPSSTPTPGPSSTPTPNPSGNPSSTPSPNPSGDPSSSPSPNPSGDPSSSPSPNPSGEPSNSPSPSPTDGPDSGGPQDPGDETSETLGEKLDQLEQLGEQSDRERENGGRKHGLADKPW